MTQVSGRGRNMQRYTSVLLGALAYLVGTNASYGVTAASVCPAPQPSTNMTTTFYSDFTASNTLNASQWTPFYGLHGGLSQELELYLPWEAYTIQGTGLVLQTDKSSANEVSYSKGRTYDSGEITTQGLFSQTYGHFEALAKVPQANGLWPAFWLLAENGVWPPEIDAVEYIYAQSGIVPNPAAGKYSLPATTLHWMSSGGAASQIAPYNGSTILPLQTDSSWNTKPAPAGVNSKYVGYHLYSVDWRPGSITWLIDNAPVFCVTDNALTGARVPNTPMYLLLNDAVTAGTQQSPGWAGYVDPAQTFPIKYNVAYVSVSQFNDLPVQAPLPLTIRSITASPSTASPGQTIRLYATVKVGNYNLGQSINMVFGVRNFDSSQYNGIGGYKAWIPTTAINLLANETYNMSASYTIPASLPAGRYGISFESSYSSGPFNGPGATTRYASVPQGTLIVVTAAQ